MNWSDMVSDSLKNFADKQRSVQSMKKEIQSRKAELSRIKTADFSSVPSGVRNYRANENLLLDQISIIDALSVQCEIVELECQILEDAVSQLPEHLRQILELRYFKEKSPTQIQLELFIGSSEFYRRMKEAEKKLILIQYGQE